MGVIVISEFFGGQARRPIVFTSVERVRVRKKETTRDATTTSLHIATVKRSIESDRRATTIHTTTTNHMGTACSRQDKYAVAAAPTSSHNSNHNLNMFAPRGTKPQSQWRIGRRQRAQQQEGEGKAYPAEMPHMPHPLDEEKFRAEGSSRVMNTLQYQQLQHPQSNNDNNNSAMDFNWKECMPPSPIVQDFAAVATQNSRFRKYMEDECVAIPKYKAFHGDPAKSSFFGVYDGHGGDFCSKYAATHFHTKLSALMETKFNSKRRDSELSNHSAATSSSSSITECFDMDADVLSPEDIENCYVDAFASIDKELENYDESSSSGSTAVTCLVRTYNGRTTFHVANVGDSRAIFYSNSETTRLTVDHKATNQDEVKRIKALNGIIFNKRVGGVIAVTRALGQADEKPFISSAPHTESVEVVSDDSFLVLVSDGVTDVFSDEQVTQFVADRLAKGENSITICRQLLNQAKDQGSMDNMTAIVIRFGGENQ